MESSLSLVNDLLSFWTVDEYGNTSVSERVKCFDTILTIARRDFTNGESLLRLCDARLPFVLRRLVFPDVMNGEEDMSLYVGLSGWSFLGPSILDALRNAPHRFASHVGYLVANRREGTVPGTLVYTLDRDLLTGFFGEQSAEVVDIISNSTHHFGGSNKNMLLDIARSWRQMHSE
jgi:hypothetical protein